MPEPKPASTTESDPRHSVDLIVSLREKASVGLHHWLRILEDAEQHRTDASVANAREQIVWIRGYLRALDDALQANSPVQPRRKETDE